MASFALNSSRACFGVRRDSMAASTRGRSRTVRVAMAAGGGPNSSASSMELGSSMRDLSISKGSMVGFPSAPFLSRGNVSARSGSQERTPSLCGPMNKCIEEEEGSVKVRDDLDSLLKILPENIREPLENHPKRAELLEIVMDMGRRPEARFLGAGENEFLREQEVSEEDLLVAEDLVGEFGADNRAGITGTLHRISAIRNRKGKIVGLTCRVGRAVMGHIDMIRDTLHAPESLLFLGRPGVGKTTVIREMARVLSDELHKRVVIVDTSNEIGGDGDIPHPAIGGARRMQVPNPAEQHRIMIEAVENHMPEVVIVDEIGTEAEALACRTIAERGVQLVGTAHGQILENIIKNPTLADLVGGVQSVTLGDEEARTRGTQKSVLERKGPPTFPRLVEMRERGHWVEHHVEESVDALLHGKNPTVQVRRRAEDKTIQVQNLPYDDGGEYSNNTRSQRPHDEGQDFQFPGSGPSSFGGAGDAASPSPVSTVDDPYAWAQRLRDIPDKDALQELASLGYIGSDGSGDNMAFSGGGGGRGGLNGKAGRRGGRGKASALGGGGGKRKGRGGRAGARNERH